MFRSSWKVNIGACPCIGYGGYLPFLFSIATKALFFHHFHGGTSLDFSSGVALFIPEKALRNVFYVDVDGGDCGGCRVVDDCFEHHERF